MIPFYNSDKLINSTLNLTMKGFNMYLSTIQKEWLELIINERLTRMDSVIHAIDDIEDQILAIKRTNSEREALTDILNKL